MKTPATAPKADAIVEKCRAERSESVERYQVLMKSDPWKAMLSIRECAKKLNDVELLSMVAAAERADLLKTVQGAGEPPKDRLQALNKLAAMGEPIPGHWESLRNQLQSRVAADEQKKERDRLVLRKKQGVRVGDTMKDAIESSWGHPVRVNKTVNAYGTSEQWVYGGGNYLYFRDGVIESIQIGN